MEGGLSGEGRGVNGVLEERGKGVTKAGEDKGNKTRQGCGVG